MAIFSPLQEFVRKSRLAAIMKSLFEMLLILTVFVVYYCFSCVSGLGISCLGECLIVTKKVYVSEIPDSRSMGNVMRSLLLNYPIS